MRQRLSSPSRSELLAQRAGTMRTAATPSEQLLWLQLRGKQLGVSFKRQVPLGGRFIVDFLASSTKLALEAGKSYYLVAREHLGKAPKSGCLCVGGALPRPRVDGSDQSENSVRLLLPLEHQPILVQ